MLVISLALLVASAGCAANADLPSPTAEGPSLPTSQASPFPSPSAAPVDGAPVPTEEEPVPSQEEPVPTEEVPPPAEEAQAPDFAPDSYIVTVSDGLRVRSKPGVRDDSRRLTPLLPIGTELFVVKGPERASGFDWYQVAPLDSRYPFGWVAAGREGEPWLDASDYRCPDGPVDAASLAANWDERPFWNLVCLGSRDVKFTATMGGWEAQCGVDPCCVIEPCWLADAFQDGWLTAPGIDPTYEQMYGFRFDPKLDRASIPRFTFDKRVLVKVTGQFDHPASARCRPVADVPDPIPAPWATLLCRTTFVVSAVRALDR